MTKYGFYAIVQKRPDESHVSGWEQNLAARVPLPGIVPTAPGGT